MRAASIACAHDDTPKYYHPGARNGDEANTCPMAQTQRQWARCDAEWYLPTDVLVQEPSFEVYIGALGPVTSLFQGTFDTRRATIEHRSFVEQLERHHIRVHRLSDAVLKGTRDRFGRVIDGPPLQALRSLARSSLTYDATGLPAENRAEVRRLWDETILKLGPEELFLSIVIRPTFYFQLSEVPNSGYNHRCQIDPQSNLTFVRDQQIITPNGLVLGKLNSVQRRHEVALTKLALANLDVKPFYELSGSDSRMEGGDYLPCMEYCMIWQGLRTNELGVKELLDNHVFGCPEVVVIKDPWQNQDQMHVDTWINMVGPRLAVCVGERLVDPILIPKVDTYRDRDGRYRLERRDEPFPDFLQRKRIEIIPITMRDQERFGVNYLCIGDRHIIGVNGQGEAYRTMLRKHGVRASWVDLPNLSRAWGALHCCVQALRRVPAR